MKLFFLLSSLLALQAGAQTNSNPFAVVPDQPQPGSQVAITYKDKGTVLEGRKNIRAVVYHYGQWKWQATDLPLTWKDTAWVGNWQLPAGCGLITCIFTNDTITDNGGKLTYAWLLSDGKGKQQPGAFYAWGTLRNPSFAEKAPFRVDSTAYIADEVTRMWCRYEVRDHPDSRPFIFKDALGLYKKTSEDSATDDNIRKELADILRLPNLTEQAWIDALDCYSMLLQDRSAADSLETIILQKYPDGILARDKVLYSLFRETDLNKKISEFDQFITRFPPAQFAAVETANTALYYNKLFRTAVYTPIMKDSNYSNFYKYLPMVPLVELNTFYHHLVEIPYEQKMIPLKTAMLLSDTLYKQIMNHPVDGVYSPLQWPAVRNKDATITIYTHAKILMESKQYARALATVELLQPMYGYTKADYNDLTVRLLQATGKKQAIRPWLMGAAKENALSPLLLDLLKKEYIATKNRTGAGFEAWVDALKSKDKALAQQTHLKDDLINQAIAPFNLESAKGGFVDLEAQRGKIVVLDFWATWCAPCKAAMPGMQLAVNKYKADQNVAFYFIATQETKPDYKEQIKKFIAEKKYSFEVLYDGYNEESKHLDKAYGRYAKDYQLSGIPMKMIIDQQGRLRWLNTGYKGSPSALADEISFIIELLKEEASRQSGASNMEKKNQQHNPYTSEAVSFTGVDSALHFAGTLTLPAAGPITKAVVLVSGTGKQDRDGTMAGHKMFARIADTLSRNGIAVLRVDDRGTGETTGSYEDATTEDFATDALQAIEYLRTRPGLKAARIGLLGHSEGGAAAAIAAASSADVQFVISLAGLAVKGIDALLVQNRQLVAAYPDLPQYNRDRYNDINQLMFYTVYTNVNAPNLEQKLRDTFAVWKAKDDKLVDSLKIQYDHFRFPLESYVRQATGKWYRYHIAFDPAPFLSRITVPVLAIQGDKDLMLHGQSNLESWQKYAGANGKTTTRLLPNLNHLLQACSTCSASEYARLGDSPAPEVLAVIVNWLLLL
ncbi:MAG: alpha/beta fold hydrolase [Candidatus Pseudobacter hemicellulosilyticus]|uniref:Alpha/beta fold hydrolase n=1 Tax=Candidatus Pseudobacter hemicellulosilyticus TaxID=3121375 RepID=A0AAJ5WUM2_9BACT|nr:MAG: alpha/beta fold hydrolase [Pseudobacter sp.]